MAGNSIKVIQFTGKMYHFYAGEAFLVMKTHIMLLIDSSACSEKYWLCSIKRPTRYLIYPRSRSILSSMSNGHDARYKWVFSHPSFVKKFLQSFVKLPFVKKLDFSSMERLDKEFVSEEFREKESDIVYRIKYLNTEIYIFMLIEFQSTVDKTMPVRFMRYTGELYQFAKPNEQSGRYAATFPILLYNGDAAWNAPLNVADLIEHTIPKEYIPQFRYFPVLINEFSRRTLVKIRNVVSAMFYIENSRPEELDALMDELIQIIHDEDNESLQILCNWFNGYLQNLSNPGALDTGALTTKIQSVMEVKNMFATKLKEHDEKLRQDGRQEERIEAARRMKTKGYTAADIAEITGLGVEEIEKL